jgi:hypothetical protein
MYNQYNKVDEKALARQVHGANHGEGVVWSARPVTAAAVAVPSETKTCGVSYGLGSIDNKFFTPEPVSDSERMIRLLDALADDYQQLSFKAARKLDKFAEPQPVAETNDKVTFADTRQCSSPYFLILESRIERLQYTLNYLASTINAVSTPEDMPLASDSNIG